MRTPITFVRDVTRLGLVAVIYAATAQSAAAAVISPSATLPILGVPYTSVVGAGCFPAVNVCISAGNLTLDTLVSSTFDLAGQSIVTTAAYSGSLTTLGGDVLGPLGLTGTVEQRVVGRTSPTEIGSWSTELVALSLSGPVLGRLLTVGLDPAHDSTGSTRITQIDVNPELYEIASVFDIFVALRLGTDPPLTTTRGPLRFETVPDAVPEPAGVLLMGMALAGLFVSRRSGSRFRSVDRRHRRPVPHAPAS